MSGSEVGGLNSGQNEYGNFHMLIRKEIISNQTQSFWLDKRVGVNVMN